MSSGSNKLFGVMIIAGAVFLVFASGSWLVNEYQRPAITSQTDAQNTQVDDEFAEFKSTNDVNSTLITTAWISFIVSTIFAVIMVITGIRIFTRID